MSEEYKYLFIIYFVGLSSVIIISAFTYFISNKFSLVFSQRNSYLIFIFSFLFYIFSVLILSFGKINSLHHYVDFATHLEILWKNSQGLGLITLMSEQYHESSHWFAAHFTPIIYLTYVPAFLIWPNPLVIPLAETIFILSSLVPLWLISKKYFSSNLSIIFICSFLFYPTIFYTNLYGIAYVELFIPLFLWLTYFYEEKKNYLFFFFLILCLLVREEVSLVTTFFGLYILIKKRFLIGFTTIFLSLIYFYIVIFIIMPSFKVEDFNNSHIAARWFNQFGDTYLDMILYLILNPIDGLSKILTLPKIGNFIMYLIPLLFTPFLNFFVFLIALPNLAITFLSSSISHSSYILYYLSPSLPVFFYASIIGINKCAKSKYLNHSALIHSILVASISTTIIFGGTPISISFWNKDYKIGNFYTTNFHYTAYQESETDITAKQFVKLIPDNAIVSAEQHFLPLLFKKKKMIIFPIENENTEYVMIDRFNSKKTGGGKHYLSFRLDPELYYQKYLNNSNWSIIAEDKGVILLKKNNL